MSALPRFNDPADQDWYEERAAILEFDALMSRPRAEAKAQLLTWQMIIKKTVTSDKFFTRHSKGAGQ